MEIQQITDVKELKALAYDQLVLKTLAENNLQLLQQRIAQLEQLSAAAQPAKPSVKQTTHSSK
ncbi:MAG TPA: hypothetical protein VLG11_04725 [Candidatus Saccharimonadales bacterium]|nr:hypothetical protein [Candidatus Saccharimonadales bacterium]